jgi:hypothetical protein
MYHDFISWFPETARGHFPDSSQTFATPPRLEGAGQPCPSPEHNSRVPCWAPWSSKLLPERQGSTDGPRLLRSRTVYRRGQRQGDVTSTSAPWSPAPLQLLPRLTSAPVSPMSEATRKRAWICHPLPRATARPVSPWRPGRAAPAAGMALAPAAGSDRHDDRPTG